jgi:hypothetical protein
MTVLCLLIIIILISCLFWFSTLLFLSFNALHYKAKDPNPLPCNCFRKKSSPLPIKLPLLYPAWSFFVFITKQIWRQFCDRLTFITLKIFKIWKLFLLLTTKGCWQCFHFMLIYQCYYHFSFCWEADLNPQPSHGFIKKWFLANIASTSVPRMIFLCHHLKTNMTPVLRQTRTYEYENI